MGIFDRTQRSSINTPFAPSGGGGGGGGGTVTSVAVSVPSFLTSTGGPITTSGTIAISLATQLANTVFAGPTSGGAAAPAFRALVAADIPALAYVPTTRVINTTAPLAGGGALSADLTLSMPAATSSQNGYLTSTDWSTFNNKQPAGNYITALTGDVTATGPGSAAATIATNVVTNTKLAQMAANTFKANNTGATANATDITGTQATVLLDVFTSALKGLAPASGGGTTNFLRADGTWAAPTASAPTGTNNTVAYFNGSGVLSSEANFSFNTSIKSFAIYSGTGSASASGFSSVALGRIDNAGASITSSGAGSWAIGYATGSGGQIDSQDAGCFAGGYATAGKIISENSGSFAFGSIGSNTASRVRATTGGGMAFGAAGLGGIILSSNPGAIAMGYSAGGNGSITASGQGSHAFGSVDSSSPGAITASGTGSGSRGFSQNGGIIQATSAGAWASGRSIQTSSLISASGLGSFAHGACNTAGSITASGRGSFAGGSSDASGEATSSSGEGSFSYGHSHDVSADFGGAFGIGHLISSFSAFAVGQYADVTGTTGSSVDTEPAFVVGIGTGTGARLNGFSVGKDANLKLYRTITAGGTTGNQTINKPAGTVNFAAGGGSVTVTNNLVTVNSIILTSIRTVTSTGGGSGEFRIVYVLASAGSFEIVANDLPDVETSVGFLVLN